MDLIKEFERLDLEAVGHLSATTMMKLCFLLLSVLGLAGCTSEGWERAVTDARSRYAVVYYAGNWGPVKAPREWRVQDSKIMVGRREWNRSGSQTWFVAEFNMAITPEQLASIKHAWEVGIDRAAISRTAFSLSDSPQYEFQVVDEQGGEWKVTLATPGPGVMPAVEAFNAMLPKRYQITLSSPR